MRYQIEFTPRAEKYFALLPKSIQKRIVAKLQFFEKKENPLSFAKKLQGEKELFRFRIGDYRVIFTPQNAQTFIILLVLKIGHRREIYD